MTWLAIVLTAAACAGLALAAAGPWAAGMLLVGAVLLAAAALRLTLPPQRLGVLALRARWLDVTWMLGLGLGTVVMTTSVVITSR